MKRALKFFHNIGTGILISVGFTAAMAFGFIVILSAGKWFQWVACTHNHEHGCKVIVVEEPHP